MDVWIQNGHTSGITIHASNKDGNETLVKTFNVSKTDKYTNRVVDTGYTKITAEEHEALLAGSKLYKKFLEDGRLVKYDEAPVDALNPAAQLVKLSEENRKLTAKVKALEESAAGVKSRESELSDTVDKLTAELIALREAKEVETKGAVADIDAATDAAIEALNLAHADEIAELKKAHADEIAEIKKQFEKDLKEEVKKAKKER